MPSFCSYQADVVQIEMDDDGMRIDVLEETLDRLDREGRAPKFIYTVPTFQNPAGVTLSLERRRAARRGRRASASCSCSRTTPTACCATRASRCRRCTRSTAASSSSTSGRSRRSSRPGIRLGWAVAPRPVLEKMNLGKQGADLCSSSLTQLFVAAYFAERRLAALPRRAAPSSTARRRDAMLDALAEHFPPEATWTRPQGGLFIWATLPDYIDTTDLLARALREQRRVRARAAPRTSTAAAARRCG